MPNRLSCFCLVLGLAASIGSSTLAQDKSPFQFPPDTQELSVPMTPPADALKMLELPDGFKATLFAAEPDVHQPISLATDACGRLWVAECYTYSDGKENYNTDLNDRIVIFEDTDNDGVFDSKKIFWDQGKKLTSVEVGFGGVWVTAAPNLMFIPDADQDDVPDGEPEVLLNGFEGDVIRHNIVNGLRWGPDGWLYGRHGIQATSFVGPPDATDSQRVPMNCAIWRFHPQYRKFEIVAQGGTNPWGFDFDVHGEMFMINTVIGHLFHIVPNALYRRMYGAHFNPHAYQVIEQTADHFHWDASEEHWAVTKKEGMSDGTDRAGGGHAHTGLMIYQGDNWPEEFRNCLFTANFHGRRINSDSIQRQGNSYVAHHGPDYFKTTDPWFRGIEMVSGPDGGVYLADWSDIGECHENDGIHRASGRIFKLTFGNVQKPAITDLANLSLEELINLLSHDNDWYARKARRLLQERVVGMKELRKRLVLEKGNESSLRTTEQALETCSGNLHVAYGAARDVRTKLRIMWTIYSCDQDIEEWLLFRLLDNNEHIRAWAVRMLADGINDPSAEIAAKFVELAKTDSSGLVRLYLASSIPRFDPDVAFTIASALASRESDANDRVQPHLVWFGCEPLVTLHVEQAIQLAVDSSIPLLRRNIARRLTAEIDTQPLGVEMLVARLADVERRAKTDMLIGMTEALNGFNRAQPPKNWPGVAEKIAELNDARMDELIQNLNLVFGDGRAIEDLKRLAKDTRQDVSARRQAIAALATSAEAPQLFEFFKSQINDKALTTQVTKALVRCEEPAVAKLILNCYSRMDPEGQAAAINTLVSRNQWASQLLQAIASQRIPKAVISAGHARQISNFGDQELQSSLESAWGVIRATSGERRAEIERLQHDLSTSTFQNVDREQGRAVFEKSCASCHTMFGRGGKIGPDLTGSDRRNINYLLENIVDPGASVAQSYQTTIIAMEDGRFLTGVIVEENERIIKLQTKDDLVAIDVQSIDARKPTRSSLMPDGLLDQLTDEQIASLFRFLSE